MKALLEKRLDSSKLNYFLGLLTGAFDCLPLRLQVVPGTSFSFIRTHRQIGIPSRYWGETLQQILL